MDPAKMFAELKAKTANGGINFNEISKDINTTVSGGGSSTVKVPDMSEMTKKFEASFADFNTGFEDVVSQSSEDIADAMTGSKASVSQSKIDAAIEEKKKASETLAFMLNNIADEDWDDEAMTAWDEAIDRRDAAKEKLDKAIEESISDLAEGFDEFSDGWSESVDKVSNDISDAIPYDEFGDLDGAIAKQQADSQEGKLLSSSASGNAMNEVVAGSSPTASQGRGITSDSITIGPNGMPIAKPKSTAAAAPDKPAEKKASPGKAINPETGEEYTPLSELEKQAGATKAAPPKPAGGSDKAATLDDVVKSLNALNTKMGQLIDVNETGHKASAKAAKSTGANLYNK